MGVRRWEMGKRALRAEIGDGRSEFGSFSFS
jgi:hypothetical protein